MPSLEVVSNKANKEEQRLFEVASSFFSQQKYRQAEESIISLIDQVSPNATFFNFAAKIKKARGFYTEQINFLNKSLELNQFSGECLVELAFAHINLYNFEEAYCCAGRAGNIEGNDAETYSLAARVYYLLGDFSLSVNMLEKAVALNDADFKLLSDLGDTLALCGKMEKAVDAYEKSIFLDSNYGLAHAGLAKSRTASANNNNVEELKKLVIQHRNPWTGINIAHGLAKELDDLGRYQESYEVLSRGKKRLRNSCPYDPNYGAYNTQKLVEVYAKHAQEITDAGEGSKKAPIFVVGMPRTGTTIVERILTNHVDVPSLGERNQLSVLLREQCKKPYPGLVDAQILDDEWSKIDFAKLGEDYIKSVDYLAKNSHRFVDKLPLNVLLSGVALHALPKAKIVCLLRNPLDTIVGNYRQVFEQSTGTFAYTLDFHALANYVYEFRQLVSFFESKFPSRFLVVRYESLVMEPLSQAKNIFDFCDLQWCDEYVNIHKNSSPVGTASAAQVQEPIQQKYIGKSNNYMFCLEEVKRVFQARREI